MTTTKYRYTEDGRMTPESFQRMKDDRMVAEYMAVIDTRIDERVLGGRVDDEFWELVREFERNGYNHTASQSRLWRKGPKDFYRIHIERDADLQRLIEEIRASDGDIDTERDFWKVPPIGPYDGNHDKYLAYVLDVAGPNYADEETGSTEWDYHIQRFGRVILMTDSQGFRTIEIYGDEHTAIAAFQTAEAEYCLWDADDDDETYDPDEEG